jgi:RNA polymerase sigma-70 factor (ECF subfamily)
MLNQKQRSVSEWLVIRAQQGERSAFDTLIKLWHQRFYVYAMKRTRDREVALDITQEALVSISRNLQKLSDPAGFPKWSFRILERRYIDWQRKVIRERQVMALDEAPPEPAQTDNTEARIDAKGLLARLDPDIRVVLQLYYLDGMNLAEIAEILDVPTGTVKSRLYYARKLANTAEQRAQ